MNYCEHCGQATPDPTRASVWYMHDNHTFTQLEGNLDEIIAEAQQIASTRSPYGSLCPIILLNAHEKEVKRVGRMIFGRPTFSDDDINAWSASVMLDPDAARLLRNRSRNTFEPTASDDDKP